MGLALASFGCFAQAGLPQEGCDLAYKQLSLVPSLNLKRSTGNFTDDGISYNGCIVVLKGNREKIKNVHYPYPLFYPSEGSAMYKQGWLADREADGPDGTRFRISRQNIFCVVKGNWDGRDDSDPNYVPSNRYEVIVSCSYRQQ